MGAAKKEAEKLANKDELVALADEMSQGSY